MTYRSPSCSITEYKKVVENVLMNLVGNVIFFGDINIDLSREKNASFKNFMSKFALTCSLDATLPTTNDSTHIDCVFSNVPNLQCSLYETYFSHHKAICIIVQ